ncbi:MAG: hypothetical protein ACE5JH_01700 [Acidobacteriota bacterium]
MTSFAKIETRAADLICATCGTSSMQVALRCDSAIRECLSVATCRECGRVYDAEILPTHRERYEAVSRAARETACPACGGRRRTVHSLCDRVARRCYFLLLCGDCGDSRPA